jgi:hypothetical protein
LVTVGISANDVGTHPEDDLAHLRAAVDAVLAGNAVPEPHRPSMGAPSSGGPRTPDHAQRSRRVTLRDDAW